MTMHSLLKAMRGSERSNVHLVVVDTSAQHPQVKSSSASNSTAHDLDLVRPFVDSIIDAVPAAPSHGDPEAGADQHDSERHHSWERKELQDYATALRYCDRTMKKRHSMTIVLEDDIIVSEGFLAYLNALCDEHHCLDEPLGTIKLFTTEYYWGWETKETAWLIETGLAVSMPVPAYYFLGQLSVTREDWPTRSEGPICGTRCRCSCSPQRQRLGFNTCSLLCQGSVGVKASWYTRAWPVYFSRVRCSQLGDKLSSHHILVAMASGSFPEKP